MRDEDLTKQTFNQLYVIAEASRKGRRRRWRCVCQVKRNGKPCGRERILLTDQLKRGSAKACRECSQEALRNHRKGYGKHLVLWAAGK